MPSLPRPRPDVNFASVVHAGSLEESRPRFAKSLAVPMQTRLLQPRESAVLSATDESQGPGQNKFRGLIVLAAGRGG
jgi:hypothetical protein